VSILKKILIISSDIIGVNMAGPGARYWNFAKVLADHFKVVLFTPNECPLTLKGVEIEKISSSRIKTQLKDASSVIVQGTTLWFHPYIKKFNVPIIVDLYDPFIFENLELFESDKSMHRAALSIMMDQLYAGDYFICASEKQRDFYLGMLSAINRINTMEYALDKTMNGLIGVVPFGIPREEPVHTRRVLKGQVPGIGEQDKVLIWGGGIWDWLDPFTAVYGMKKLLETRQDVKLFFIGTQPPNPNLISMKHVKQLISLADFLGLTNKYVFFNSWAAYEDRQNYLLEADIGINLHYNHIETRFAFRTRMLDYIWCNLPVVTTEGDVLSQLLTEHSFGLSIEAENAEQFASAVNKILNNYQSYTRNSRMLLNELTWENCMTELIRFCENPRVSAGKNRVHKSKGLVKGKTHYYLLKGISYMKSGNYSDLFKKIKNKL